MAYTIEEAVALPTFGNTDFRHQKRERRTNHVFHHKRRTSNDAEPPRSDKTKMEDIKCNAQINANYS